MSYTVPQAAIESYQLWRARWWAKMEILTALKAKNIKANSNPSADGTVVGLSLHPGSVNGTGKWILRFISPVNGKRREMGLGRYPDVVLAEARDRAIHARKLIASGQDPIQARQTERLTVATKAEELTFEQASRAVHKVQKAGWSNGKHVDQWLKTLEVDVFPKIGKVRVSELTVNDFADVLRPIWMMKPETASRVKQRCHTVMKWCQAKSLVKANPVDVVDLLLPKQPDKRSRVQHFPAMPWRDIPTFFNSVREPELYNVTRGILEFIVLTAVRSGSARKMTWDQVDLEGKIWIIPPENMKNKLAFRVPLSARAIEILKKQKRINPQSKLVFPSPQGKILSDMAITKFLKDHRAHSSDQTRHATVHGFRSSFRDWASENDWSRDVAERALAHTIKSQTEAAYHRTDLLEKRRVMMDAWGELVCGNKLNGKIDAMRSRSA